MYNLLEYSSGYYHTMGSLLFYSKDEAINFNNYVVNNHDLKYFKYKAKLFENTEWNLKTCNNSYDTNVSKYFLLITRNAFDQFQCLIEA